MVANIPVVVVDVLQKRLREKALRESPSRPGQITRIPEAKALSYLPTGLGETKHQLLEICQSPSLSHFAMIWVPWFIPTLSVKIPFNY